MDLVVELSLIFCLQFRKKTNTLRCGSGPKCRLEGPPPPPLAPLPGLPLLEHRKKSQEGGGEGGGGRGEKGCGVMEGSGHRQGRGTPEMKLKKLHEKVHGENEFRCGPCGPSHVAREIASRIQMSMQSYPQSLVPPLPEKGPNRGKRTRVWCIPEFGAENECPFPGLLLVSAVMRVRG